MFGLRLANDGVSLELSSPLSMVYRLHTKCRLTAHHQAQVERRHVHQQTLEDVRVPPQMHASHPAGFIQVGEATFQLLAALPQQPLPTLAPNPPPVPVHRRLLFLLTFPAPPSPLRLRTVTPDLPLR